MRQFKVTCIVGQGDVEPITGLLAQLGGSFQVEELMETKAEQKRKISSRTEWCSKPGKAVLNVMIVGQKYFYKDASLSAALSAAGYGATSISPVLSHLAEIGKVKRVKRGHYMRT